MRGQGAPLLGRVLLVVDDDYLVATDLCSSLRTLGAHILGPVPTILDAIEILASGKAIDGVLLDVELTDGPSYPIADRLLARGIPFLFVSGISREFVPERHASSPLVDKFTPVHQLVAHLGLT